MKEYPLRILHCFSSKNVLFALKYDLELWEIETANCCF